MKVHVGLMRLVATVGVVSTLTLTGCGGAGRGGATSFTPAVAPMGSGAASVSSPAANSQPAAAVNASPAQAQAGPAGVDAAARYISKLQAERIALKAVHGGTVTLAVLETTDLPVHWSIDITNRTGDYEVWVNARTAKVLAIIKG